MKCVFLESSSLASLQTDCYGELMLTIDKWHLDDAHKDKQNKIFDQNFKVNSFTRRAWNSNIHW